MRAPADLRLLPAYRLGTAARYLHVSPATLHAWTITRRDRRGRRIAPLVEPASTDGGVRLSFVNLVEAHVLKALRFRHFIAMPRLRMALANLRAAGQEHPLADRKFLTENISLLEGQPDGVMRDVATSQLLLFGAQIAERVEWDAEEVVMARALFPFNRRDPFDAPKLIQLSPYVSFGRPTIVGTRMPTFVVAQRFRGGDSIKQIAEDYALSLVQVRGALAWERVRVEAA